MRSVRPLCWLFALSLFPVLIPTRSPALQFGVIANPSVELDEQAFDKSHFSQLTTLAARKRCEDWLQAWLELVDQAAALSEDQRSKLELAGQIDIHRFFASYEDLKRTIPFGKIPQAEWQARLAQMQDEALPLKTRYREGLHGEASLFAKTLSTTLSAEQNQSVHELLEKRVSNVYLNNVRVTLAVVDRIVPLTRKQRNRVSKLLISRTEPPASYETSTTPIHQVLRRMAQVEEQLRELFSDQEWEIISKLIQAGEEAE